jgi:hypothetical protein
MLHVLQRVLGHAAVYSMSAMLPWLAMYGTARMFACAFGMALALQRLL